MKEVPDSRLVLVIEAPGEVSHSFMWRAVSSWRILLSSPSF
jgi:hypothetical protein